jgi:predicted MFS family arabinose efflux permease
LCLRELHDGRGLTEIEEAWLVRSRGCRPTCAMGLISPCAAVAVRRLPRGNQPAASGVVVSGSTTQNTFAVPMPTYS